VVSIPGRSGGTSRLDINLSAALGRPMSMPLFYSQAAYSNGILTLDEVLNTG
jgi:hypothetical protein